MKVVHSRNVLRFDLLVSALPTANVSLGTNEHAVCYRNCLGLLTIYYTVKQKKTAPFYFCNNFVKSFFTRIIIGTHIR